MFEVVYLQAALMPTRNMRLVVILSSNPIYDQVEIEYEISQKLAVTCSSDCCAAENLIHGHYLGKVAKVN